MKSLDIISLILIIVFLVPVIFGAIRKYTDNRFFNLLNAIIYTVQVLFSLTFSIYLSKMVFFNNSTGIFKNIYDFLPDVIKSSVISNNIIVFVLVIPVIFILSMLLLSLIFSPLVRFVINPFSEYLDKKIMRLKSPGKRAVSALFGIPSGLCFVLITVLILSVYSYFIYNPGLKNLISNSGIYQTIYSTAISPVFDSNIAKKIPVLLKDSFKNISDNTSGNANKNKNKNKVIIIKYFNGVTLEQAVKSNAEINSKARQITATADTETMKAYLLYKWVSENIYYDYDKANMITKNVNNVKSGTIITFNTRKGICFDYSSLYISMCRALNLKVRLITGLANSGLSWGDHSWNEVYSSEEKRWIKVDTTFGKAANYFDNPNFNDDHIDREVQQQW